MGTYYDRIAERYDESRYLTAEVAGQAARFFIDRAGLTSSSTVLEPGIGTSSNVLPLVWQGIHVVGTDVSGPMLEQARKKGKGRPNLQLLLHGGDTLPFLDESFDAVLTVHMLHNVGQWEELVGDIRRVLKPEGVYFFGEYLLPPHRREFEAHHQALLARQPPQPGPQPPRGHAQRAEPSRENVRAFLLERGAAVREDTVARWGVTETVGQLLGWYEARLFGSCWSLPDEVFPGFMRTFHAWCLGYYDTLDAELSSEATYRVLSAGRWPEAADP